MSKANAAADSTASPRPDVPMGGEPTAFERWLARLSMSFVIVAAALAWQAYKAMAGGAAIWRPAVDLFAAAAAIALAAAGVRQRHRRRG